MNEYKHSSLQYIERKQRKQLFLISFWYLKNLMRALLKVNNKNSTRCSQKATLTKNIEITIKLLPWVFRVTNLEKYLSLTTMDLPINLSMDLLITLHQNLSGNKRWNLKVFINFSITKDLYINIFYNRLTAQLAPRFICNYENYNEN